MNNFEYIRSFWKYIDEETPILLFHEIDLNNDRYATRMCEVFTDRTIVPFVEPGFEFVTEAPVPTIDEINLDSQFFAELISKDEFEKVYKAQKYMEDIDFPK